MRPARMLRQRALSAAAARRMNEVDRVVRNHVGASRPETFYATSGESSIERAGSDWMPHHYKPTIGFTP